jgi:PAP2 superfamily
VLVAGRESGVLPSELKSFISQLSATPSRLATYALVPLIAVLVVLSCWLTHLHPSAPQPLSFLGIFSIFLLKSAICAAVLYQVAVPAAWSTIATGWKRLFCALPLLLVLLLIFRSLMFIPFFVLALAFMEFCYRRGKWKLVVYVVAVLLYLVVGLRFVIESQAVIVWLRGYNLYDATMHGIDLWLLVGGSASGISHLGSSLILLAETVYYAMFYVIGVGIIFLCLADKPFMAIRMCNALIVAYTISTLCFALWPSTGPFFLCPDHLTHFPQGTTTLPIQKAILAKAIALHSHQTQTTSPTMYYISFPAMHVTIPLIVAWFLRRWKWVAAILVAYTIVLVPAILILEWHYFIDIVGGVAVAALAVVLDEYLYKEEALQDTFTAAPIALVHGFEQQT